MVGYRPVEGLPVRAGRADRSGGAGQAEESGGLDTSAVFIITYVPLMGRFLQDLLGRRTPIEDIYPPDVDLTEDIPKAVP